MAVDNRDYILQLSDNGGRTETRLMTGEDVLKSYDKIHNNAHGYQAAYQRIEDVRSGDQLVPDADYLVTLNHGGRTFTKTVSGQAFGEKQERLGKEYPGEYKVQRLRNVNIVGNYNVSANDALGKDVSGRWNDEEYKSGFDSYKALHPNASATRTLSIEDRRTDYEKGQEARMSYQSKADRVKARREAEAAAKGAEGAKAAARANVAHTPEDYDGVADFDDSPEGRRLGELSQWHKDVQIDAEHALTAPDYDKNLEEYQELKAKRERVISDEVASPGFAETRRALSESSKALAEEARKRIKSSPYRHNTAVESGLSHGADDFEGGVSLTARNLMDDKDRESINDVENYRTALRMSNAAEDMVSAPVVGTKEGKAFIKGFGDTMSTADFWTMGINSIVDQTKAHSVLKKIQDKLGKATFTDENELDGILSDSEKALVKAFYIRLNSQGLMEGKMKSGYEAGSGAADSAMYMAQFMLAGAGVKAASTAATKAFAGWLGREASSIGLKRAAVKTTARLTADIIGEGGAKAAGAARTAAAKAVNAAAKYGIGLTTDLAKGTAQTVLMPGTYANMADELLANVGEDGRLQDIKASAVANSFIKSAIDNSTESRGGTMIDPMLKKAFGPLFGAVGKRVPAQVANMFKDKDVWEFLKKGGYNGIFGEVGEEWDSAFWNKVTGLDKSALENMATWRQQWILVSSFAPTMLLGGSVSGARYLVAKKNYSAAKSTLEGMLRNNGYSDKQIEYYTDYSRAYPKETGESLRPSGTEEADKYSILMSELVKGNTDMSPERIRAFGKTIENYIGASARLQTFDGLYREKEAEQRTAEKAELYGRIGQFWIGEPAVDGKDSDDASMDFARRVRAANVTDKDGRTVPVFVLSESNDGQIPVVSATDGSKFFITEDRIQSEEYEGADGKTESRKADRVYSLKDYLSAAVMEKGRLSEETRMGEEKIEADKRVAEAIVPGTVINRGTPESPDNWEVTGVDNGMVTILSEDKGSDRIGLDEAAKALGVGGAPMTDAQAEEAEADAIIAEESKTTEEMSSEAAQAEEAAKETGDSQRDEAGVVSNDAIDGVPIPMNEDGTVNQTDLWNASPEAWAKWNTAREGHGREDTLKYVHNAVVSQQALVAEARRLYDENGDLSKRDGLQANIGVLRKRLDGLTALEKEYAVKSEEAKVNDNSNLKYVESANIVEFSGGEAETRLSNIMKNGTEAVLPDKKETAYDFDKEFATPVKTVLGEIVDVKRGVFNKIIRSRRNNISGALREVLEDADFVINDIDGSRLYVKMFNTADRNEVYNVTVVNKKGELEDYISSVHIKTDNNLINKIRNGAKLLLPSKRTSYEAKAPSSVTPLSDSKDTQEIGKSNNVDKNSNDADVPKDFRGNPLPMRKNRKGDTVVNEAALWKRDPEAWCAYNDANEKRIVGTKEFLESQLSELAKQIVSTEKALRKEALKGFDSRKLEDYQDNLDAERAKVGVIKNLLDRYNQAAESGKTIAGEQRRQVARQNQAAAESGFPGIRQRWDEAGKIDGLSDELLLSSGESVQGHYVLTDAMAMTPSHNPFKGFAMSDGFPVDGNGKTVNDRDYEKDKGAQEAVNAKAADYDQRALQTPVFVSDDGVVLSGNDRTMAGQMAAKNGTDGKYVGYLSRYSQKYGFSAEQIASFDHPRVVFVPDNKMEYSTSTFAKFNADDKKTQNRTEKAVKAGKTMSGDVLGQIATLISGYEDINELYSDASGVDSLIGIMADNGIVAKEQVESMRDGAKLSGTGMDLVESMLLGSVLEEDALRAAMSDAMLRKSVASAIAQIIANNTIEGYTLKTELADAVSIVYAGKKGGDIKFGESAQWYVRQGNIFGDDVIAEATVQMLADALNAKKTSLLKKTLESYNREASLAAQGQMNVFSGGAKTKEEILKEILNELGYEVRTYDTSVRAAERQAGDRQSQQEEQRAAAEGEQNGTSVQSDAGAEGQIGGTEGKDGRFQYFKGSIKDLVDSAKTNASTLLKKIVSRVTEKLSSDLRLKGIDVDESYIHTIDNSAIRHTLKKHGENEELKRGQIPITAKDFERIPEIVDNYDSIKISKGNNGENSVVYSKEYPDGTTIFIEEKRSGRKELAAVTMWKAQNASLTGANRTEATLIPDLKGVSVSKDTQETEKSKSESDAEKEIRHLEEIKDNPGANKKLVQEEIDRLKSEQSRANSKDVKPKGILAEAARIAKETGKQVLYQKGNPDMLQYNSDSGRLATEAVMKMLKDSGVEVVNITPEMLYAVVEYESVVRLAKKKALDDTVVEDESSLKATVVSSNAGSNILKNIDKSIAEYEKTKNSTRGFIVDAAKCLRLKNTGKSQYGTFKAVSGQTITIRLSNHNATVSNFDGNNEPEGISIVISRKPNERITNDGMGHIVEFFYSDKAINELEGRPLVEILKSIKQSLYSGEYKDTTGLAQREEVNADVTFLKDDNDIIYGCASKGAIYLNKDRMNPNTPIHEYTHLWFAALKDSNPELYARGVELMKQMPIWNEVTGDENYSDLKTDYAIASECLSRLVGDKGAEKLNEIAKSVLDNKDMLESAKGLSVINRFKDWLKGFWTWVRDSFSAWSKEDASRVSIDDLQNMTLSDLVKGINPNDHNSGKTTDPMFQFSSDAKSFKEIQKRAVEENGIVSPGLLQKAVMIVNVPKHDFSGSGKQAIAQADEWARNNIVGEHTMGNGDVYNISNSAIGKYLSESATGETKSDNLGVHLAVLKKLPEVINASRDVEIHPDYKKVDGVRSPKNGIGNNELLVHRMYGAVNIDSIIYRVKTTMHEYSPTTNLKNAPHSYEVTKIELLEKQAAPGAHSGYSDNGTVTYGITKLLQGVEKSYDKGKFLLDESEIEVAMNTDSEDIMPKEPSDILAEALSEGTEAPVEGKSSEAVRQAAEDTANALGVTVEYVMAEQMPSGHSKAKGYYKSGRIFVCLDNHASSDDVVRTVIHEAVGHKGIRGIVGEKEANAFLFDLYKEATPEIRSEVAALSMKYGGNISEAMEEWMAGLAEKMDFSQGELSLLARAMTALKKLLASMGLTIRGSFSLNDAKSLLYQSYHSLKKGGILDEAAKQHQKAVAGTDLNGQEQKAVQEKETRFRDAEENSADDAAAAYSRSTLSISDAMQERLQDQFLSVERLQDAIAEESGKPIRDFEDTEKALNRLDSVNAEEHKRYFDERLTPLIEIRKDIAKKTGLTLEQLDEYMMLKHGLERNEVFNRRDGNKEHKDYSGLMAWGESDPPERRSGESRYDYDRRVRETATNRFESVADAEAFASDKVDSYESVIGKTDVKELWQSCDNATDFILDHGFNAGMIRKEEYNRMKEMFKFYVPLRGFSDDSAEDLYTYYGRGASGKGTEKPIIRAKGRRSKAESPISHIGAMADSAIALDNKNKAKQTLALFLAGRPNSAASLSQQWYVKADENDENSRFVPVYPDFSGAKTAEDVRRIADGFEADMKSKAEAGKAFVRGNKKKWAPRLPETAHIDSAAKPEHIISLKINGNDFFISVNGSPRAAQAINDMLSPKDSSYMMRAVATLTRLIARMNTSLNPEFVFSNFERDLLNTVFVNNSINTDEDSKGFWANYPKVAGKILGLMSRHSKGNYEAGAPGTIEYLFDEFARNGGITGFTRLTTSDEYSRILRSQTGWRKSAAEVVAKSFGRVESIGEAVENLSRFTMYVTRRKNGATVERAIDGAKEITVNFNRKGSGAAFTWDETGKLNLSDNSVVAFVQRCTLVALSQLNPVARQLYAFLNAGIQGIALYGKAFKASPARASAWTGMYAALGAVNFLLHSMMSGGGDGDDDKNLESYMGLSEYERRNNMLIQVGACKYLKIAMPQELRAAYAIGDILAGEALGMYPHKNMAEEIAKSVSASLPLDVIGSGGFVSGLMPTGVKPFAEAYLNEDYTGSPIHADAGLPWNMDLPKWQLAYSSTNKVVIEAAKVLSDATIGKEDIKGIDAGAIDLNPATIQHIFEGLFGGTLTFVNKTAETGWMGLSRLDSDPGNDAEVNFRRVPFVSRVITRSGDRMRNAYYSDAFYYYKGIAERRKGSLKRAIAEGPVKDESVERSFNGKENEIARLYDAYKKQLDLYRDYLSQTENSTERREILSQMNDEVIVPFVRDAMRIDAKKTDRQQ